MKRRGDAGAGGGGAAAAALLRLLRFLLRPWAQVLLLYLLTFGLALPLLCHDLRHSRYFRRAAHLGRLTAAALEESRARGEEAARYFREAEGEDEVEGPPLRPDPRSPPPQLVVAIVTTARGQGGEYRYYLQVAAAFHRLLRQCPWCRGHRLFACNVHRRPRQHLEALAAARLVPTAHRFEEEGEGEGEGEDNLFEKEKRDYLYCLRKALTAYGPRHVLLVEDDALPREDFFPVLRDLLERRLRGREGEPLYVKLYHPERLQGYLHPEPARLLEWLGLGALGGWLLSAARRLATGRWPPWPAALLLGLWAMLAGELGGRHYLLQLRRLSPQLYALSPASSCCTPATLFPAPSARRVLAYLGAVHCRPGYAKDTALYGLLGAQGEWALVLEPNLVTHIGLYSTLRGFVGSPASEPRSPLSPPFPPLSPSSSPLPPPLPFPPLSPSPPPLPGGDIPEKHGKLTEFDPAHRGHRPGHSRASVEPGGGS
uniref:post-GPI attachment to proteins factor 4 n=1 Tax=Pristiophorus japonicus TaxID=55135 RepID=UPI00398F331D